MYSKMDSWWLKLMSFNPNTFKGGGGESAKKNYLPKEERREGGEKHVQRTRGGQGSNPGSTMC